jgi:hypothetical protein
LAPGQGGSGRALTCADVYLSRENEVAFRPFGLGLFDELVAVCERVRAQLEKAATEAGKRVDGLPELDDSTEAGRFLLGLTGQTTDDQITEACTFIKEQRDRRDALAALATATRRGDTAREAERLLRLADRVERAKTVLDRVEGTVSATARDDLVRLRDDAAAKREAARMARTNALTGARLGGVGNEAWRVMWEAARTYSERDAYPDRDFPVVEDAACLLCHQPLDDDAARRLHGFEEFVRDTTQRAADDATVAYEALRSTVRAATIGDQATTDLVQDLAAEDAEAAALIESYLAKANTVLSALKRAISDGKGDPGLVGEPPDPPTARLDITIGDLRTRGNDLRAGADAGASDFAAEFAELDARNLLHEAEVAIRAERDRLQRLHAISIARTAASTNAITAKSAELTNAALTEVLMDRFSRETDRLGLENVVLRTVGGRRGVLRYRTGFVGAVQDAPLPDVLSEGEQTALGMAGFLAEVWTDPGKSGVIFDDPVSSLDHERRDKVAERLVTLADERQTIVFTHDVAFVLALKKHAVLHSVDVTERCVEKRQAKPGHCGDFHKFSAKLVKERLAELEEAIASIKRRQDSMPAEEYRDATARWYRLLRQTWERAIEEGLVGQILTRDDLQVHPTMVRTLVLFTAEDNRELQYRYGRATELSEVHDESAVINSPPPTIGDLEDDLTAIRSWHKTIAARRSLSEDKVYELASEAAGD